MDFWFAACRLGFEVWLSLPLPDSAKDRDVRQGRIIQRTGLEKLRRTGSLERGLFRRRRLCGHNLRQLESRFLQTSGRVKWRRGKECDGPGSPVLQHADEA